MHAGDGSWTHHDDYKRLPGIHITRLPTLRIWHQDRSMYKSLVATSCRGGGKSKVHTGTCSTCAARVRLAGLYRAIEQPIVIHILTF